MKAIYSWVPRNQKQTTKTMRSNQESHVPLAADRGDDREGEVFRMRRN